MTPEVRRDTNLASRCLRTQIRVVCRSTGLCLGDFQKLATANGAILIPHHPANRRGHCGADVCRWGHFLGLSGGDSLSGLGLTFFDSGIVLMPACRARPYAVWRRSQVRAPTVPRSVEFAQDVDGTELIQTSYLPVRYIQFSVMRGSPGSTMTMPWRRLGTLVAC